MAKPEHSKTKAAKKKKKDNRSLLRRMYDDYSLQKAGRKRNRNAIEKALSKD